MPSNHLSSEEINRYSQEQGIPSQGARHANQHLADCASCRQTFAQAMQGHSVRLMNIFNSEDETEDCPNREQMLDYVRGEADVFDVEIIEMHQQYCAQCRLDIAGLKIFYEEMENAVLPANAPPVDAGPPLPALASEPISTANSETEASIPWWRKYFAWTARPQIAWGTAAFAVCLAFYVVRRPSTVNGGMPDIQLAQMEQKLQQEKTARARLEQEALRQSAQFKAKDEKQRLEIAKKDGDYVSLKKQWEQETARRERLSNREKDAVLSTVQIAAFYSSENRGSALLGSGQGDGVTLVSPNREAVLNDSITLVWKADFTDMNLSGKTMLFKIVFEDKITGDTTTWRYSPKKVDYRKEVACRYKFDPEQNKALEPGIVKWHIEAYSKTNDGEKRERTSPNFVVSIQDRKAYAEYNREEKALHGDALRLGMAQIRFGDLTKGERTLQALLRSNATEEDKKDAKKLLEILGKK